MKKCSKCEIEKELSDFHKRIGSKDGLRSDCKECYNLYKREYKRKNQDRVNEYGRVYYKKNFEKVKENRENNRESIFLARQKYYEENKEVIKEKARLRYNSLKDDDHFMERTRNMSRKNWIKYRENNRDRINEKIKDRKHNDPLYKLKFSIRNSIYNSINRMGYSKKDKSRDILGCTFEYFMKYIEEQFLEGMSWENYGEWHLDHKTPVSWAETEEQIYELNKYTNFQPLWAKDNLSKGNKWSD
jgi:hypothetical protein